MRRYFQFFGLMVFCVTVLMSCGKETVEITDTTVGHSRILFFPSIATKGNKLTIVNQGAAFTDPGAVAILAGQTVTYQTKGTVNTAVPGVYDLSYSAANPEGYSASDFRTVVVIGSDVTANDFSGTYLRAATGVSSIWKKTATGIYEVENPGGAASGKGYKVIVVNYQGNKIKMPKQIAVDPGSGSGTVSSTTETYNAAATPVSYSWVFLAGGYGTALRTFVKQ